MRIEEIRRDLTNRLRERRAEIEQAAMTRIYSVSETSEGSDPEYLDGLRSAVSAALEYGIEALQRSEDRPAPIPTVLLSQARLAARHGVKLETVLRRYLAGHTLLGDFLIQESERDGLLDGASLKRMLRTQAVVLDRLLAAVSEEYAREVRARPQGPRERHAELVRRLLAGDLLDTTSLGYEFDVAHLGLVASGEGASETIRALARALDCRLLLVPDGEETVWAWLGGRRAPPVDRLEHHASRLLPESVSLAIGESGEGLAAWRRTHHQARAALPIAVRGPEPYVRYTEVALLAAVLQDHLCTDYLRQVYLMPLESNRDGGEAARKTIGAYFAAERNISSAAAALEVSRQAVRGRLQTIEERIGRPLEDCASEMELALRLHDLEDSPQPETARDARSQRQSPEG